MPALADLDARLIRYEVGVADKSHGKPRPDGSIQWGGFPTDTYRTVATLAEAQGVWFACPLCYQKNKGLVGTHYVSVFFPDRGVPDRIGLNKAGKPVRWRVVGGTGLDNLQLAPSILLEGPGCGWHGFIGTSGVPPGHAQ